MPRTQNFNWDLFVTGQVKVSEPLNRIVTDVDDFINRLVWAVTRLGEGVLDGLIVTLTGSVIEVSAGVAVKKGYLPFVLTRSASLQKSADSGYVVVDWGDYSVKFVLAVADNMTVLAQIDGSTVTDLRAWAGKGSFNTVHLNPVNLGNISGSVNIDWAQGNLQKATVTDNTTLSFVNPQAGQSLTLILVQGGSATVSFPSGVKWNGGNAPTMPSSVNKVLVVSFLFDGTDFYGWQVVKDE